MRFVALGDDAGKELSDIEFFVESGDDNGGFHVIIYIIYEYGKVW